MLQVVLNSLGCCFRVTPSETVRTLLQFAIEKLVLVLTIDMRGTWNTCKRDAKVQSFLGTITGGRNKTKTESRKSLHQLTEEIPLWNSDVE